MKKLIFIIGTIAVILATVAVFGYYRTHFGPPQATQTAVVTPPATTVTDTPRVITGADGQAITGAPEIVIPPNSTATVDTTSAGDAVTVTSTDAAKDTVTTTTTQVAADGTATTTQTTRTDVPPAEQAEAVRKLKYEEGRRRGVDIVTNMRMEMDGAVQRAAVFGAREVMLYEEGPTATSYRYTTDLLPDDAKKAYFDGMADAVGDGLGYPVRVREIFRDGHVVQLIARP